MAVCRKCGKEFHACSSCCLSYSWEYNYCGDNCYLTSKEYLEISEKISNFLQSLNRQQSETFHYDLSDTDLFYLLDKIKITR